jgi:hypothetical protein
VKIKKKNGTNIKISFVREQATHPPGFLEEPGNMPCSPEIRIIIYKQETGMQATEKGRSGSP